MHHLGDRDEPPPANNDNTNGMITFLYSSISFDLCFLFCERKWYVDWGLNCQNVCSLFVFLPGRLCPRQYFCQTLAHSLVEKLFLFLQVSRNLNRCVLWECNLMVARLYGLKLSVRKQCLASGHGISDQPLAAHLPPAAAGHHQPLKAISHYPTTNHRPPATD